MIDFTGYVSSQDPRLQSTTQPPTSTTQQPPTSPSPQDTTSPAPAGLFNSTPPAGAQFSFQNYLQTAVDRLNSNSDLLKQKNLLIKHLYDSPLSTQDISTLPKSVQDAIASGDKSNMEMQLRLMNDQISGRANTMNQSIDFLTKGYQSSIQEADTQRQNALTTVNQFITQYGSNAPQLLKSLYGQGFIDTLKNEGIDIESFAQQAQNIPTIIQGRYGLSAGGAYNLSTYNPSNPNYSNQIQSIAGGIGNITDSNGVKSYISSVNPNSPITGDMVMNSASKYGVDPATMMAIFQQESSFNTQGAAVKNNNPGNIKFANQPNATKGTAATDGGNFAKFATLQDGVNAEADWLSKHQSQPNDLQVTAQGILDGSIPPPVNARGTINPTAANLKLEAEISKKGGNLTKLALDWSALQKWMTSANSTTQLRLRQAITSVQSGIEGLRNASNDWNAGGFAPLNAANLKLALSGTYGKNAQKIAAIFDQQKTIIQDELGQTFMGGNSPTDSALSLSGKTLDGNWSKDTLSSALDNLDKNLGYRLNSIETTGPIGVNGANSYFSSDSSTVGGPAGTGGVQDELSVVKQYFTNNGGQQSFNIPGHPEIKTREDLINALKKDYPDLNSNDIYSFFPDHA